MKSTFLNLKLILITSGEIFYQIIWLWCRLLSNQMCASVSVSVYACMLINSTLKPERLIFHLQKVDGCLVKTGFHFMNQCELKII